jgi:hypothetical protein
VPDPLAYYKDPDAELDYAVDWSAWLGTDTIASAVWEVRPAGLTIGTGAKAPTTVAGVATVWLSGGTSGTVYLVSCRVTTATGRVDDRSHRIICTPR